MFKCVNINFGLMVKKNLYIPQRARPVVYNETQVHQNNFKLMKNVNV